MIHKREKEEIKQTRILQQSEKLLEIIQFATSHYKLQNNTRINVLYVIVEYWRLTVEQEMEDNGFLL